MVWWIAVTGPLRHDGMYLMVRNGRTISVSYMYRTHMIHRHTEVEKVNYLVVPLLLVLLGLVPASIGDPSQPSGRSVP